MINFLALLLLFQLIKIIKSRRLSIGRYILLSDMWGAWALSIFLLITSTAPFLAEVTIICVWIIFLWLFIDAVIFSQLQLEVNWHAIKIAISAKNISLSGGGMSSERDEIFTLLREYKWISAVGIAICTWFASQIFFSFDLLGSSLLIIFEVTSIFALTKSRLNKISHFILWLCISSIFIFLGFNLSVVNISLLSIFTIEYTWIGFILIVISLAFLQLIGVWVDFPFFRAKGLISRLLFAPKLPSDMVVKQEHLSLFAEPIASDHSYLHAKLKGQNIVLITMESLQYKVLFEEGLLDGIKEQEFWQEMRDKGSIFRNFSLSPNTNNMLTQIYSGSYSNKISPHLKALENAGYESYFLTNQSLDFFGMKENLSKFGFQNLIDKAQTTEYGKKSLDKDILLWLKNNFQEKVVNKRDGQPFFMHILSDQTHYPYRPQLTTPALDSYIRYKQAVRESIEIVGRIIKLIRSTSPNTLFVFMGDHGQAFGSFGYYAHSNAIVSDEVEVPLAFFSSGKDFVPKRQSSHFDLMPTLLDLLGIECSKTLGYSMFSEKTGLQSWYFHSETKYSSMPSNSGFILENDKENNGKPTKYMFDWILDKAYMLNPQNDEIIQELTGEKKLYLLSLLNQLYRFYFKRV